MVNGRAKTWPSGSFRCAVSFSILALRPCGTFAIVSKGGGESARLGAKRGGGSDVTSAVVPRTGITNSVPLAKDWSTASLTHGRSGDRQANAALYRIVLVRLCHELQTREHMKRRTGEGMSKTEVIRCLKRYVAREVFTALKDSARVPGTAP